MVLGTGILYLIGTLAVHFVFGSAVASVQQDPCHRDCDADGEPRECYYHWTVRISFSIDTPPGRTVLSLNNQSPGPVLRVCPEDRVVVDVLNLLPGLETSIHWHGLQQRHSPHMDGVPMVTQCPIQPHTTFRYTFTPEEPGTFLYHAYSARQQSDGLYGALVVGGRGGKTVTIAPQMEGLTSLDTDLSTEWRVERLVSVVTQEDGEESQVVRLINAASVDCPVAVQVGGGPLWVRQMDASPIKPVQVPYVILQPGERVEVSSKGTDLTDLQVVGFNLCKGKPHNRDSKPGSVPGEPLDPQHLRSRFMQLKNAKDNLMLGEADVKLYIPLQWTSPQEGHAQVDFRYRLGENSAYTPSYMTRKGSQVAQVEGKSFLYPPSPLLSQYGDVPQDMFCTLGSHSVDCGLNTNGFCECLQVVDLPFNQTVDLVLVNEGRSNDASPTFHIHGYSFYGLAMEAFGYPLTAKNVEARDEVGKLKRNFLNPVLKDTVVVPNKGYVVLRIRTDNPGFWMVRSTTSQAEPAGGSWEFVLKVPSPTEWTPPPGFPTCRTMKKPDQIFG